MLFIVNEQTASQFTLDLLHFWKFREHTQHFRNGEKHFGSFGILHQNNRCSIKLLPVIIERIEAGKNPGKQAGKLTFS